MIFSTLEQDELTGRITKMTLVADNARGELYLTRLLALVVGDKSFDMWVAQDGVLQFGVGVEFPSEPTLP